MSLPTFDKPTFTSKVPSTGQELVYRPFLVKEEKILLMAQESNEDKDIVRAISQILTNCVQTKDFDVHTLTMFDLEYLFLKLRAKSVNNIVELRYQDVEDEKIYDFTVNLDDVEVLRDPNHTNKIQITDKMGLAMKYPSVQVAFGVPEGADLIQTMDYLILSCIDYVYDEDSVYTASEESPEELQAFIDQLDVHTYEKIKTFFETMPKMYHMISYTNSNGTPRTIELTSLRDFFSWG